MITKENAINDVYEKKREFVEEYIEDHGELITEQRLRAINRWLETDENHRKIKEIKDDIKLVLYNNKDIVLETKNKINEYRHVE